MPSIIVNGNPVEAPEGDKLLTVLLDKGVFVPHFCYHGGLRSDGNCRMCLVKVSTSRKLEVACMTDTRDGMEVTTECEEVDAARKAVLEFMLINHPLDCPICDKAGECMLQDQTYSYRGGLSRFDEAKNIRHTKDLGPNVKIWGNRCIACNRCIRFCTEVVGTGELALVNRGDRSVIDVHPDVPLDNPMSLNVVDLCPVGALINKNFLYQARVWFTARTDTVCTGCAKGCNITATVKDNQIKRVQPRLNPEVNGYWMCDAGRLNNDWISSDQRLRSPEGTVADLGERLHELRRAHGPGSVAVMASAGHGLEELFLIGKIAQALGAPVGAYTRQGERWESVSGWEIPSDKTPNLAGVQRMLGGCVAPTSIAHAISSGQVKALLSLNALPGLSYPTELLEAAARLDLLAVSDVLHNEMITEADFVVPGAAWAEKDGTMMNHQGRVQRLRKLVEPPARVRPEVEWLQELLVALKVDWTPLSADGVLRKALGLSYAAVGSGGVLASTRAASGAAPTRGPSPEAK